MPSPTDGLGRAAKGLYFRGRTRRIEYFSAAWEPERNVGNLQRLLRKGMKSLRPETCEKSPLLPRPIARIHRSSASGNLTKSDDPRKVIDLRLASCESGVFHRAGLLQQNGRTCASRPVYRSLCPTIPGRKCGKCRITTASTGGGPYTVLNSAWILQDLSWVSSFSNKPGT